MKVILPEHGAYFRGSDGLIRIAPMLHVVGGDEIIKIAIPPDDPPAMIFGPDDSYPVDCRWRKA